MLVEPAAAELAPSERSPSLPALIESHGPGTTRRFLEFFAVTIRNRNTREAYARALRQFFDWCAERGIDRLEHVEPMHVAAYIEGHSGSPPTRKQHLAAIRMCFDWLVTGQILAANPATSVKGPSHVVARGKTAVLTPEEGNASP